MKGMGMGMGMALWGFGLIVCGVALFGMETTVSTPTSYSYGSGISLPGETFNLGLLRNQAFVFIAGCALFVAGVALHAIGVASATIITRIGTRNEATATVAKTDSVVTTSTYEPDSALVEPADAGKTAFWFGFAVFLVCALLAMGYLAGEPTRNSAAATAIERNAEATADHLEAAADTIEAMARSAEAETVR